MKSRIRFAFGLVCLIFAGLLAWFLWYRTQRPPGPLYFDTATSSPGRDDPGLPPVPEIPAPPRSAARRALDTPATEVVGIGLVLKVDGPDRQLLIAAIMPGSPAADAGLTPGWIVRQVDGADVTGVPLAECIQRIRGPEGTKVRLELFDPDRGTTNRLELSRRKLRF